MNLKTFEQRTISLKIVLILASLAVIAFLSFGILETQQANASNNNQPTNGSTIVSVSNSIAIVESNYGVSNWVPVEETILVSMKSWDANPVNVLQYAEERTISKVEVSQNVYPYVCTLFVTIYDNNNMKREINFEVKFSIKGSKWLLNGRPVPQSSSVIDYTSDNSIVLDNFNGFNLAGTVTTTENTASPIEGAFVQYLINNTGEPVPWAFANTNSDGSFIIFDIPVEYLPGAITVSKEGYKLWSSSQPITSEQISDGIIDLGNIQLSDDIEANFVIVGDEHHNYFNQVFTVQGEIAYEEKSKSINKLAFPVNSTYSINEAGALCIRYPEGEVEIDDYSFMVIPFAENGFVVDKWNVNGSNLEVGKTYTIISDDELNCLVTYKIPDPEPKPGYDPGSIIQTENGKSSTQTGDKSLNAEVALIMIALLSTAVILRKKYNLK